MKRCTQPWRSELPDAEPVTDHWEVGNINKEAIASYKVFSYNPRADSNRNSHGQHDTDESTSLVNRMGTHDEITCVSSIWVPARSMFDTKRPTSHEQLRYNEEKLKVCLERVAAATLLSMLDNKHWYKRPYT